MVRLWEVVVAGSVEGSSTTACLLVFREQEHFSCRQLTRQYGYVVKVAVYWELGGRHAADLPKQDGRNVLYTVLY